MNEGVILPICEADLENVLALQKVAFRRVAALVNKYDMPSMVQTLDEMKEEADRGTILKYVVDGDGIVGSVRAYCDEQNVCRIGKLVVHPRFENRGIGKALMDEIENYFPQCCKFALFTGKKTPNTFYLYSKLGYREVDQQVLDGVPMFIMEKNNPAYKE